MLQIWNDAEKFAKYAFNKSHSAAYAVLVMRTAWLKALYPYDYMAAVLSSYMGKTDKLTKYIASCNHGNIPVLPPDVNSSNVEFTPVEAGIRFGLMGVKGVGAAVADAIISERKEGGNYTSLHDLLSRVDAKLWNKKPIEALIKGGAFDSTGYSRKELNDFIYQTDILNEETQRQKDRERGQMSIFDAFGLEDEKGSQVPAPTGVEWPRNIKNNFEREVMGMYVSDHPMAGVEPHIASITPYRIGELAERKDGIKSGVFVGLITDFRARTYKSKRTGKEERMCNFNLEDTSGAVECVCFNYAKLSEILKDDAIVKVSGKFDKGVDSDQIVVFEAEPITVNEGEKAEDVEPIHVGEIVEPAICLELAEGEFTRDTCASLERIVMDYPGTNRIIINLKTNSGKKLESYLPTLIDATNDALKSHLNELFGRKVA